MTHRSLVLAIALSVACGGGASAASTESTGHRRARSARARAEDREDADRLAQQEARRRERALPTAADQSEASDDVEITRQIRVAVVGDSSLSLAARNVTIITRDAVVTLRGDVRSNAERDAIERHAQRADGVTSVENLLSVEADE